MRSIRFPAIALMAIALSFGFFSSGASAQEDEDHSEDTVVEGDSHGEAGDPHAVFEEAELILHANDAHHADIECVELILVEDMTVADCRDAPNPLLPETNEIIWGGIGFLIVFFGIAKFGFPAIKQSMNDRTERIRADLEEAEQAKVDAQGVLDDYRAQLSDAKAESGRIIEEARQQADGVRRDQEAKLQTDLSDMRTKAAADIEASKAQVMSDLQGDVAALAIGAAEIVVEKNLDQATQIELIENYINQVNQRS